MCFVFFFMDFFYDKTAKTKKNLIFYLLTVKDYKLIRKSYL